MSQLRNTPLPPELYNVNNTNKVKPKPTSKNCFLKLHELRGLDLLFQLASYVMAKI